MKRFQFSIIAAFMAMLAINLTAQEPVLPAKTAEKIMNKAFTKADSEGKNVIVMFHASWCGWCKKMDASIDDESCKEFFHDNYVITHLVVKESKGKEHLENPGAIDIYNKHSGGSSGIPFWLIYDSKGNVLEDGLMSTVDRNGNPIRGIIGCPASDEEVAAFVEKIRRTSKLTEPQLKIIADRFRQN